MRMSIAGIEAEIPREVPTFFRGEFPINRKHGRIDEFEIYSLYLAIRALEIRDGIDLEAERRRIVGALQARQRACQGFWVHEHPSGNPRHSNTRSTAAALQTLFEAYADGLVHEREPILRALDMHLAHSDRLENGGLWFLHDSFELPASAGQPRPDLIPARVWGSSERNGLVLNTHANTLVVLLHAFDTLLDPHDSSTEKYAVSLREGLSALAYVLRRRPARWLHALIERVDCCLRRQTLREFGRPSERRGIAHQLRRRYYWYLRPWWKSRFPAFRYRDGYLDRSASLKGSFGYNYHALNLSDLARVAARLEAESLEPALAAQLRAMVVEALEFAFAPHYQAFVQAAIEGRVPRRRHAFSVMLCETLRLFFARGELLSDRWIERYAALRRRLAPSPALLGYDPVTIARPHCRQVGVGRELGIDPRTTDLIVSEEGRYLLLHFGPQACRLPAAVSRRYEAARLGKGSRCDTEGIRMDPASALLLQARLDQRGPSSCNRP